MCWFLSVAKAQVWLTHVHEIKLRGLREADDFEIVDIHLDFLGLMSGTDARTTKGKVNLRRQPSEHELGHNFEKVQELWFDDADAIFRTGSKAFRVHRSILSARSTIFADMFSVPQGTQTLAAMSTKPTIIDLPDAEMDVYFFFLAIFDASCVLVLSCAESPNN